MPRCQTASICLFIPCLLTPAVSYSVPCAQPCICSHLCPCSHSCPLAHSFLCCCFAPHGSARRSIELEAYGQAVHYYNTASGILHKHSHVASFAAIETESKAIIGDLHETLRKRLRDPSLTAARFTEIVSLLLDLDEERGPLREDFFAWHRQRFKDLIAASSEGSGAADGADGESTPAMTPLAFVVSINESFLQELLHFVEDCTRIFIDGDDDDREGRAGGDGDGGDKEASEAALRSFIKEIFLGYFSHAKSFFLAYEPTEAEEKEEKEVDANQEVKSGEDSGGGADDEEGGDDSLGEYPFPPLLLALQKFVQDLRNPAVAAIARQARVGDRATEIVENAIRHQVVITFKQLQGAAMECVEHVYQMCADGMNDGLDDAGESGDGGGDEGSNRPHKALAQLATESFDLLLVKIDGVLRQLKVGTPLVKLRL